MLNLTLQQIFGSGASQTTDALTIQKADLPGLTAENENRGEQLLTALILQAHQHFEGVLTDEQGRTITDELDRRITYDNRDTYEKLNLWFWKRQFIDRYIQDVFIVDVFIKPPTDYGTQLNAIQLDYQ